MRIGIASSDILSMPRLLMNAVSFRTLTSLRRRLQHLHL